MDAPPPADQAVVVDKRNPAWTTRYGTQVGLQFLAPRQATFEVSPQEPDVGLGAWQTHNLGTSQTVLAVQAVPDRRVFAAVDVNGLRVYAPTGNGSYAWSEIHASFDGLASDKVTCLAYLSGELWVGTSDAGNSVLTLSSGAWRGYNLGNGTLPSNTINHITPVPDYLPDMVVYISTPNGAERYYFDGVNTSWIPFLAGTPVIDMATQFWYGFEFDWFVTNFSVEFYDGANWTSYSYGNTGTCFMTTARRVVVDHNDTVWFAADAFVPPAKGGKAPTAFSGLCTYNNGTWTPYNAVAPGLPSNWVTDLAVDDAGRVWISMQGGAAAYDQGTWLMITQGLGFPIYSNNVTAVGVVGEAVWFGHNAATVFSQYSPNWQCYTGGDMGGSGGDPHAVLIESAQTWVGLGTELSNYSNARWDTTPIPGNTADVSALARDGNGTLWIGTAGNGLYAYDGVNFTHQTTTDGLPGNSVRALAVDHAGHLWAGTDGGLALRGNSYWLGFTTANSSLTSNDIRTLTNDSIDRMWISTGDQGINILNANALGGTAWSTQTTVDGLPSNTVNGLATDPTGVVWAATSGGLASWDTSTPAWTLQIGEETLSVASDPQGHIWAGTTSALYELEGGGWKTFHASGSMLGGDHVIALASDGDRMWAIGNGIVAVRGVLTGPIGFYVPVISSFSPMQGSLNDLITINGDHFDDRDASLNEVLFGDTYNPAMRAQVLSVSQTVLTVRVPKLALTGLIYVRAHGLAGVSADTFTVLPKITYVYPDCLGVGSVLGVYGSGFTSANTNLYIQIGTGPWRYADVSDPGLVRQILRPGDTSGVVHLRMGLSGPVISSNQTIGLAVPQVVGPPAIQQGIQAAPYEFSLAGCDSKYQPRSAMSYVPPQIDTSMFLEPLDYRHTLNRILNNDHSDIGPYTAASTQTLRLSGDIDAPDGITVTMSYLMGNGGALTPTSSEGSYQLDLRDAGDALLSSQHFSLPTGDTHGHAETLSHFSLHVPFLTGAHKAEIRHNGILIWSATVSAHAPLVSFTAPSGGSYNAASPIHVTWTASDQDSDPLQFALAYSADNGATWVQVAAALTGNSYDWTPGFIPAGTQARLRLTASDGFNTSQAVSIAFTLTPRSPSSLSPEKGATFPEGAVVSLTGGSMTSGGSDNGDFTWSYDGHAVPIGTTKDLTTTLNEVGVHTLSLQVVDGGLSDTSSITVTVVPDYDHDGMPNAWELAHQLNPLDPTDAFTDTDGDGLSNLREYQLGTNPRSLDTDGDSAGDGVEVTAGTDPLRADQTPPTGLVLNVGADALGWTYRQGDLGLSAWHIWVTNGGTGSLNWSASDDAAWLSVTPGSGGAPTELVIGADPVGLAPGVYTGHITVTAGGASGSPHIITATLTVYAGTVYHNVYLSVMMKP
jgi:hypothetical protein